MKFLILAYGHERDWNVLTKEQQDALLVQDKVLRDRGDIVAAVKQEQAWVVKAWDGTAHVTNGAFGEAGLPLAGFGIIEARDLDEAVALVKDTPCARAKGAVEIRPILASNV
ncbi:MAG TPA: YciI family protein [Thermoanaerobaculia bacterium]|nr:YciI family protein [Thermoanaerobaculia bacterium]